jgi:hypothetical protein
MLIYLPADVPRGITNLAIFRLNPIIKVVTKSPKRGLSAWSCGNTLTETKKPHLLPFSQMRIKRG